MYHHDIGHFNGSDYPQLTEAMWLKGDISSDESYWSNPTNKYHRKYQRAVDRSAIVFTMLGLFILSSILNGFVFTLTNIGTAFAMFAVGAFFVGVGFVAIWGLVELINWAINGD